MRDGIPWIQERIEERKVLVLHTGTGSMKYLACSQKMGKKVQVIFDGKLQ